MAVFINLSNHSSSKWAPEQIQAAQNLGGEIEDIAFPQIDPEASTEEIEQLAQQFHNEIADKHFGDNGIVVHVMGEMTFVAAFLNAARESGVMTCVCSTTKRDTVEDPTTGTKTSVFRFIQFREYPK